MKGYERLLGVYCILQTALSLASEPAPRAAATWQDSILLLIDDLRFEQAQAELKTAERSATSPKDRLWQEHLRTEIFRQQGKWTNAKDSQTQLLQHLDDYSAQNNSDAEFAQALRQQLLVRQASLLLQGRSAAYFLQPDGVAAEDEIAGNAANLQAASQALSAALQLEGGLRLKEALWEPQQQLWLAALQRQLDPKSNDSAKWQSILQAGLQILGANPDNTAAATATFSNDMLKQKAAAAELCSWAARQLEPGAAQPLLDLVTELQKTAPPAFKHRLLLVQADTLMWRDQRTKKDPSVVAGADIALARKLLADAWELGLAKRSLTPLQTLELGLRLRQSQALEQNLEQLTAWRQLLAQTLQSVHESQDADWFSRYGRMLPVLEQLVKQCRITEDFIVAEYAAAILLRLKMILEAPPALQVADAHALYAEFLSRSPLRRQRDKAIEEFNAALPLWQEQKSRSERRLRQIAETQNTLASLYLERKQTEAAEQNLKLVKAVFDTQRIDDVILAQWEYNSGYLLSLRGSVPAALVHYAQAEKLCKQALRNAPHNRAIKSLYGAVALNQIQGLKQHSPQDLEAVNPSALKRGDPLQRAIDRCDQYLAPAEQNLPLDTQQTIQVWRAMFQLEQLTHEPADKSQPRSERPKKYAAILSDLQPLLGTASDNQTSESAAAFYAAALCQYHLFLELKADNDMSALAHLRVALQHCQAAYQHALEREKQERPLRVLELRSLQLLGKIYLQLAARRDPDSTLLERAAMNSDQLARVEKLSLLLQTTPILQYQALDTAARILRRSNSPRAPLVLDQALQTIESKRSFGILSTKDCADNFARFAGGFDQLVDWYCDDAAQPGTAAQRETELLEQAILISDRKRSRTFLDQIRSLQHNAAPVDATAQRQEARLRELQSQLYQTSEQLLEQADLAPENYSEKLRPIQLEIERLLSQTLGGPAVENTPRSLAALAKLSHPAQICYYHLGRKKSYLWHVVAVPGQPLTINVARLQITKDQFARLKLTAQKTEQDPSEPPAPAELRTGSVPLDESLACSLTNALLDHMQPAPERGKPPRLDYDQRLVIAEILLPESIRRAMRRQPAALLLWVPDGPLHRLPFEALTLGRDAEQREQYLLDEPAFPPSLYTPSLAIFHQLSGKPRAGFPSSVLSLANPDYQHSQEIFGQRLRELKETKREQAALQNHFPKALHGSKNFFSQTEATEENFRRHAATAQLIHLGAHADASEKYDNIEASVYLSPPATRPLDSANNGRMSLLELRGLSYAECELAVLAACQTNVGQQVPLEAGATIARAFLEKGARRVLCSQWPLADLATADLLCEYFPRLAQHNSAEKSEPFYAAELQQAKRAIRAKYPEPHDWAPLILIGSD